MTIIRRQFLSLAGAALTAPAVVRPSSWPTYPWKPIRVVVMLAAGGGTDFLARLTGETVSRAIGQQIVIENRTGAGGTIGIESIAKSPADGYNVLFSNDNIASAPQILKINGDYQKDLVPVIFIARQPLVWAVHSSLKINTLKEFIDTMKKSPGKGFATSGVGSNQHFLGAWFLKEAGIKLDHVPYRGAGQAVNDLIAAHVPIACLGPTAMMPHYQNKTLPLPGAVVGDCVRRPCRTSRRSRNQASRAWCSISGLGCSCPPGRRRTSSRVSMPNSPSR